MGLLFIEIKIKEDLVYDKFTSELIGYCNLGGYRHINDAMGTAMYQSKARACKIHVGGNA